jgi:hypothetical protein
MYGDECYGYGYWVCYGYMERFVRRGVFERGMDIGSERGYAKRGVQTVVCKGMRGENVQTGMCEEGCVEKVVERGE